MEATTITSSTRTASQVAPLHLMIVAAESAGISVTLLKTVLDYRARNGKSRYQHQALHLVHLRIGRSYEWDDGLMIIISSL